MSLQRNKFYYIEKGVFTYNLHNNFLLIWFVKPLLFNRNDWDFRERRRHFIQLILVRAFCFLGSSRRQEKSQNGANFKHTFLRIDNNFLKPRHFVNNKRNIFIILVHSVEISLIWMVMCEFFVGDNFYRMRTSGKMCVNTYLSREHWLQILARRKTGPKVVQKWYYWLLLRVVRQV